MVKNKDRWSALSMSERADLIKLYVNNGVTSLDAIKKDYNSFAPGGPIEVDEYGYPADITPAIVTQDPEFNKFLMTLPDNQRFTPEEDYHTYQYWKINGRPKDFSEALSLEMYHYDSSDNSYHANSVAFDSKGIGHFMKPKHHSTVKYELDWYNKGIGTLEGGKQYPLQGEERKEWEDFRSQYQLDSTGVDYKYVPRRHYNSFGNGGDTWERVDKIVEKAEPWVSGSSLALLGATVVAPEAGIVTIPAMYVANTAGTLMDGYQAVRDFQNGDYSSGVLNGIEALAGAFGGKVAAKLAKTTGGRAIGKLKEQLVRERFNSSGDSITRLMRKGLTYEQAAERVMQNAVNYVDNSGKVKDAVKGIRDYYDRRFDNGADIVDAVFDAKDVGMGVYSGFKEEHPVEVYKRGGKLNKN